MIVQIPLPFKNAIACSRNANIIYCPSNDGAIEYYRVNDGAHAHVKGALRGRGNLIRISDNGYKARKVFLNGHIINKSRLNFRCWLITGLYGSEFQIFYVEDIL